MNDRPVIAVLVSGSGSNLQAIIDASEREEIGRASCRERVSPYV